jgi:hypothetical protein
LKKIFFLVIMLTSITLTLSAQENLNYPYKNTIGLSPFAIFTNIFMTSYERGIGDNSGINLSAGLYSNATGVTVGNVKYNSEGYLGEIQYRYYFFSNQSKKNDKIWNRMFFSPYVFERYYELIEMDDDNNNSNTIVITRSKSTVKYKINSYGGGFLIGYKMNIKRLSFETFLGGGMKLSSHHLDSETEKRYSQHIGSLAYKGIVPRLGFNIGFSF